MSTLASGQNPIERLAALLADETDRLRRGALGDIAAITVEKQRLATELRDLVASGAMRERADLRAAVSRLGPQIDANKAALEHALRVQRRLVGIVVEAARRSVPVRSYGRAGRALGERPPTLLAGQRI